MRTVLSDTRRASCTPCAGQLVHGVRDRKCWVVPREVGAPTSFHRIPDIGEDIGVPFQLDRKAMRRPADPDQGLGKVAEIGKSGLSGVRTGQQPQVDHGVGAM